MLSKIQMRELFIITIISLIHFNAMSQFFKPYKYEDSTVIYYETYRQMCGVEMGKILYELNLVASETNSDIEFTYSGMETAMVSSKTYNMIMRTSNTTYLDTTYKKVRADFKGGLNASYEVWFQGWSDYSDSVKITFSSKEEFNKQRENLLNNQTYKKLSDDTLTLSLSKFWMKANGEKKKFGREFLVFISETNEIIVFRKYFTRKSYKELIQRLK